MLHISATSLEDFMTCPRLYYYKRIKRYDRIIFDIPFLVGRTMHIGIAHLFAKKKNAIDLMIEYYKNERKTAKKMFTLTLDQEEDLNEQEYVCKGMLIAYKRKYEKLIRDVELLDSEKEGSVQVNDNVIVVIKLDNILKVRKKKILHELKTSKYITSDYVKSIRTDMQHSIYYYVYNFIYEKNPIQNVMYDIIRKPGIRQKKGEAYGAYLNRLQEWYDRPDDMAVFHVERFDKPLISQEDTFNTIEKISNIMLQCKRKEDYYQNFEKCHSYYGKRCPMYELCHEGGETKENLVLYQIRKPYHVDKSN